jgi:hypothetical protein
VHKRMVGIWPARRYPGIGELEGELSHTGLAADDDPLGTVLKDLHSQQLRVEPRQLTGVRAVEDGFLELGLHPSILVAVRPSSESLRFGG